MESYIPISFLNDFIFCPRSIYYHQLYMNYEKTTYDQTPQVKGSFAHSSIDNEQYSTRKHILQSIEIYSERYKLCGKIDTFDVSQGVLRERKRHIKKIYDGFVFQIYAQYHALIEMGYEVSRLELYSVKDNKTYPIALPEEDIEKQCQFEQLLEDIARFRLEDDFEPNINKCQNCIYVNLCDKGKLP